VNNTMYVQATSTRLRNNVSEHVS